MINWLLCCFCGIDWNCILAVLTFITLCINVFLIIDERRPHLQFSIEKYEDFFFLKVKNVGRSTAKDVTLNVKGLPIENSLYEEIKNSFIYLREHPFYIEPGDSKYFRLAPDKFDKSNSEKCKRMLSKTSLEDFESWVDNYLNLDIKIQTHYNKFYCKKASFSIRGFLSYAAYKVKSPSERIAISLGEISNYYKKESRTIQ